MKDQITPEEKAATIAQKKAIKEEKAEIARRFETAKIRLNVLSNFLDTVILYRDLKKDVKPLW